MASGDAPPCSGCQSLKEQLQQTKQKLQVLKTALRQMNLEGKKQVVASPDSSPTSAAMKRTLSGPASPQAAGSASPRVELPSPSAVEPLESPPSQARTEKTESTDALKAEVAQQAERIRKLEAELQEARDKVTLYVKDRAFLYEKIRSLQGDTGEIKDKEKKLFMPAPVLEEVYEHQRYYLQRGWGAPSQRVEWGDKEGKVKREREAVVVPSGWRWFDAEWKIDLPGTTDSDGWEYATFKSIPDWHATQNTLDLIRRRKWVRARVPDWSFDDSRAASQSTA